MPMGANLLRLHPPKAELTPEDLTGVYYRIITAVLSSVPPPQVPASVLSRGVLLLTCGCESLLYPHCGNQDLMNRDEVLNIAP